MLFLSVFVSALCLLAGSKSALGDANSKVICHYDARSFAREGLSKMTPTDLEPALSFCTHLVYGFAGVNQETFKLVSLNENLDLDTGRGNFRVLTNLKRKYPGLKVILAVGSDADSENPEKYMTLLESVEHRTAFINSAYTILKTYDFDGLDLAWRFPSIKPKKIRGTFSSLWHGLKKAVGATGGPVDEKAAEHKEEHTAFIRELKNAFRHDGYILSATVNPNVNASTYYDARLIINNLDFVTLMAYDYVTPIRNPKEADYPAPLYPLNERNPDHNIDSEVQHWITSGAPASKLILGIPTFGRAWQLTSDSPISGVPPLVSSGPAPEGPQTKIPGLLSYPEVCAKLSNPNHLKGADATLRKVTDPSKRFGTYAFRIPDENGEHGVWVGYEDPDTAGNKAGYVRAKGLGGVAINDLGFDDFRGVCSGDKFPILRAAKYRL